MAPVVLLASSLGEGSGKPEIKRWKEKGWLPAVCSSGHSLTLLKSLCLKVILFWGICSKGKIAMCTWVHFQEQECLPDLTLHQRGWAFGPHPLSWLGPKPSLILRPLSLFAFPSRHRI